MHALRPGLQNLVRLKQHYDLGIYSSATERTVKFAMNRIEKGIGIYDTPNGQNSLPFGEDPNKLFVRGFPAYLPQEACEELLSSFGRIQYFRLNKNHSTNLSKGEGMVIYEDKLAANVALSHLHGFKVGSSTLQVERVSCTLFDVVLHREHCVLASEIGINREGGKPWDTVKPLQKYFQNHSGRVVLIDDSSHKSWPGEEESMVILPTWEDESIVHGRSMQEKSCDVLKKLTDIFLSNRDNAPISFHEMVDAAKKEFSKKAVDILEMSESDSADVLPVFSDTGAESSKLTNKAFSPLHYELERFAEEATPSEAEIRKINFIVEKIESIAKSLWPQSKTYLFGSYAQGVSLPGSDLDITIVGVGPTVKSSASGFSPREKGQIKQLFLQLLDKLMETGLVHESVEIIQARIPVLKFNTHFSEGGELIPVDISFGTKNGLDAVQFIRANLIILPALRPMVLFLKAALREKNLNEVSTGGLGSYALMNIIIAYLQINGHEAIVPKELDTESNKIEKLKVFWEAVAKKGARNGIDQNAKTFYSLRNDIDSSAYNQMTLLFAHEISKYNAKNIDSDAYDLGIFLWDFLDFFGSKLDIYNFAISVLKGGIVAKSPSFLNRNPWALSVVDPQDSKHDICCRTSDIHIIRDQFQCLSQQLAEYCDIDPPPETTLQRTDKRVSEASLLQGIIDVSMALDRDLNGIAARRLNIQKKNQKIEEIYGSSNNSTKYPVGLHRKASKIAVNLGIQNTNLKKKKSKSSKRVLFYAVAKGREPGIYQSYADCLAQVHSFKGNKFRGFKALSDAQSYLSENGLSDLNIIKPTNGNKSANPDKREAAGGPKQAKNPKKNLGVRRKGSKASKAVHSEWNGSNRKKGQHFDMD